MKRIFSYIFLFSFFFSCNPNDSETKGIKIASVGDEILFMSELEYNFPVGLNEEDSLSFLNQYVQNWIKNQLVLQKAEELLPEKTKNVDSKLEQYRISLLSYEYEELYINQRLDTIISEDEILTYYDEHKDDFILKDYLVKCLILTCNNSLPEIDQIKKSYLLKNEDDENILRTFAQTYNSELYLNNEEWIYFDDLIAKVPIEDYNKRKFITKKKKLFFEENNIIYFVNIYDFKLKDAISPLSFEKEKIKSIILNMRMNELRKELRLNLYNDALKNNSFENYIND
ncbi:MAG: hypothetical protein CL853_03360 [Crocinitomicaceae bacterium]|nr:hypothetical protein [Crocinitomicaceae bacterium]